MMNNSDGYVMLTLKTGCIYNIRRWFQKIACRLFGPRFMTKIYYRFEMGKRLNLNKPQLFSEKICWYKLFYCPNNQLIIDCSDKYLVRNYLISKGLGNYLPHQLYVWNNVKEINWDQLPKKFAIKCSHGSAYNIICFDKTKLNIEKAKKLLSKWQKDCFGLYNAEPHYYSSHKRSRIIVEEFIESSQRLPIDYKIHCFNGEAKFIKTCSDRTGEHTTFYFYDVEGHPLNYGIDTPKNDLDIPIETKNEMLRVSNLIAKDFPFVRVDFYVVNGKLVIGELTFTPAAGYINFLSDIGDKEIGNMFDISQL